MCRNLMSEVVVDLEHEAARVELGRGNPEAFHHRVLCVELKQSNFRTLFFD